MQRTVGSLLGAGVVALATLAGIAASHAETPLRIGVVSRTIFYLPTWTAEQQGFFKVEGLAPTVEVYNDAHKIFTDLKSGAIQIGISSIETVIEDGYKGGSMRLIAGTAQRPPHFIIAQPEIKTLADLKGKTIGVVSMHEGTTFFIKDIAGKGGFALSDVKIEAGRLAHAGAPAKGTQDRCRAAALSIELRGRVRGLQQSRPDCRSGARLSIYLGDGRERLGIPAS